MSYLPSKTAASFACAAFLIAALEVSHAGLIHEWRFEETGGTTLVDSIGDRDAQVVILAGGGGHTLADGAVRLDGGTRNQADYIQVPGEVFDGLTDVTVELWATPHSFQNFGRVFEIGPGTDNPTDNLFRLVFSNAANGNAPYIGLSPLPTVISNLPTTANTLHHYAVVWNSANGGRIDWYRDGMPISGLNTGGRTIATLAGLPQTAFILGHSHFTNDSTANASYHALRVYSEPLSASSIATLAAAGPDGNGTIAANPDSISINPAGQVALDVLANDAGVGLDASSVAVVAPPSHGTATAQANGKILYVHGGSAGGDTFTYTVDDAFGNVSAPATVTVTVSNNRLPAPTLDVPAAPPALAIGIVDAFPGLTFDDALCIRNIPGETGRIFVGERRGIISYVDLNVPTPVRRVLLDITAKVSFDNSNEGEMGLLSFAFHPLFSQNGQLYVFYTAPGSPYFNRVSRFTVNKDGEGNPLLVTPVAPSASELVLINQVDEVFNHNAGDIHFGPGGYLYISMGDEGDQMNQRLNSQMINKDLFSAILRIDVDKNPLNLAPNPHAAIPTDSGVARFSIPRDNPFLRPGEGDGTWDGKYNGITVPIPSTVRTEFWATGLRSPWRMSFDSVNGELWVGDVGQYTYEKVAVVEKGENHGWAFREGFQQTPGTPSTYIGTPPAGFTYVNPVWDYRHTANGVDPNFSGNSVTGGVVYHGTRISSLTGAYICADFRSGNIWSVRRTSGPAQVARIAGDAGIAGFGTDPSNGDVLFADYTEGKIKRLIQQEISGSGFPQTLSDTGIFADLATLVPNPGIVAYEPNVPFWSDHALKRRWFSIPETTDSVGFLPDGNWSFPAGMLWVKHFDLELVRGNPATKKRLETRLLVRNASGSYGVSYRWNEAGTEASLVPDAGVTFQVPVTAEGVTADQTWEIPSRTSCMLCHTPVAGHALSFNTRQMDREGSLFGTTGNQIDLLKNAGYLAGPPPTPALVPAFAVADDDSATREFRVRSYLATNCVQCHQPGGAAPSSWDARPHITLEETGLIGGMADRPGTDEEDRLVIPGHPEDSILLQRIQASNGFTRMPPLGTHVLDQDAINLIEEWIGIELPGRPLYQTWRDGLFAANDPWGARGSDPDGDGISNYQEFLRGSPPLSGSSPWNATVDSSTLKFLRKAHRGYLIESSGNLGTWSLWDHPSNVLHYSATDEWIELPVTPSPESQFFRFQVLEP